MAFTDRYYSPYAASRLAIRRFVRHKLKLSPKVRPLFRLIRGLDATDRVLDVGCGTGGLLELIENENPGVPTVGVDTGSPPFLDYRGYFCKGSANALPFADHAFSLVVCSHVVEHLHDPASCVAEMLRVCRPNGWLYVEAPSPRAAWMPFFNVFWDDPTHVRPFSKVGLSRLLEDCFAEQVVTGTKRSLPAVLLGLPYWPIGTLTGDRQAKAMFAIYAFGFSVWAMGRKPVH